MAEAVLTTRPAERADHVSGRRFLILTLLLILPAILPLTAPGYFFKAHDAHHTVFWLVEYDQALRDGALWPIWAPDHALGFGYPVWLVYAPLPYMIGEVFHLLGLGFTAAIKAVWALGFVIGALGIFRLARRWWGPAAGMVAALAFTYAPYRLVQIYVRADLAEFMAWAWFPWVLLAFVALWEAPNARRAGWAGLALGALLLLHTVSPLIFAPVMAAFLLLELVLAWRANGRFPRRFALWSGVAVLLGCLIVMVFLLPGLFELRYVVSGQFVRGNYDYAGQFVYLFQFLNPSWGFGYAVPGPDDGMSFQLGLLPFLGAAAGTWAALQGYRRCALPHRAQALLLIGITLVAVFLMTAASAPLWRAIPLGSLVQFPWRLLALTSVTLALLSGAGIYLLEQKSSPAPEAEALPGQRFGPYPYLTAVALVLASFPYTRPELQPIRPQDESPLAVIEFETTYKDMRGMTRWSERMPADDDSPLVAQYLAGQPLQRAAIVAGQGTILEQRAGAASAYARVQAQGDLRLRFYTYDFPGWQATVDGKPVQIEHDPPLGLIGLNLGPGEHEVRLRFGATPVRRIGGALSLLGLAGCVGLMLYRRRK